MAYPNSGFGFQHRPSEAVIDLPPPDYFDDEVPGVLDSDAPKPEIMSSPELHFRRDSHADSIGLASPADSTFEYANQPFEPNSAGPSQAPWEQQPYTWIPPPRPRAQTFVGQPHSQSWPYAPGSGHCTPTSAVEYLPAQPPPAHGPHPPPQYGGPQGSFSQPPPQRVPVQQLPFRSQLPPQEAHMIPLSQVGTPRSPHSHAEWMAMADEANGNRPIPKRLSRGSPGRTIPSVEEQRRSGIRKKNGRIEIPEDRSIETIEKMIETSNDDELLKELKQQKRLLRNREAALASRQRKKKHTEDLEYREKGLNNALHSLQSQNQELSVQLQRQRQEMDSLMAALERTQRENQLLQEEMQRLRVAHAEETGQLRQRNNYLSNALDNGAPPMSVNPSSVGLTEDLDKMGLGQTFTDPADIFLSWPDHRDEVNEPWDTIPELNPLLSTMMPSGPPPTKAEGKRPREESNEQPVASGLLFFLLLCGAFVASKPASSRISGMPHVPDDVRAVAPGVLEDLLADAAAPSSLTTSAKLPQHVQSDTPGPSAMPIRPTKRSKLEQMHQSLTTPSEQQKITEAFAMSTAQYESLFDPGFPTHNDDDTSTIRSPFRRPFWTDNFAKRQQEAMRSGKADVYTRSLLWERIPESLAQEWRAALRDRNDLEARQQQQVESSHNDNDDLDDLTMYKSEI